MHGFDPRARKGLQDGADQLVVGDDIAARPVGGIALRGDGGLAGRLGHGDGPASARRLRQQGGEAGGQIARRIRFGPQLDHRRGEANQMDGVQQLGVQQRLPLFRHQRHHVAELPQLRTRRPGCRLQGDRLRGGGRGQLHGAAGNRARAAAIRGRGGRAERRDGGCANRRDGSRANPRDGLVGGQPAHELPRRGQVGHMAQPDQHHLRRRPPIRRGLHLAYALQQHLPGARQGGHRKLVRQRCAAGALGLRQFGRMAQFGDRFQPGQDMDQLQQVAEEHAQIGAPFMRAVGDPQDLRRFAGQHGFQHVEHRFPIGQAQHVGHRFHGDLAFGLGDGLVEQRQPVAHRAIGGPRDEVQRGRLGRDALGRGDPGEMRRQLGHAHAPEIEALAA